MGTSTFCPRKPSKSGSMILVSVDDKTGMVAGLEYEVTAGVMNGNSNHPSINHTNPQE